MSERTPAPGEEPAAPRRKRRWILRLIVTVALLTGIFWFIPFSEVATTLREVRPGYLAAGFAVFLVGIYLQAYHLWLPLRRVGMGLSGWEIFQINMSTRFYAQFLPSDVLAGAVKLHRLAGPGKQWGEAVAALAFSRLVNMLTLVLMGIAFWAIEMPTGAGRWAGVAMVAMAAVLAAGHLLLSHPTAAGFVRRLLPERGFSWLQGKLVQRGKKLARTMVESYRLFGAVLLPLTALAVLRHLLGMVYFALFALSVDVRLSWLTIGWVRVVLQALMMLPITLSGVGVREGSLVLLLQEYGVSPGRAVALSFLLFLAYLLGNSLGGIFELRTFLRSGGRERVLPGRAAD